MQINRRQFLSIAAAVSLSVTSVALLPACAQSQPNSWITTWTASPMAPRGVIPSSFSNRTVRQIVRVSIGGRKVRLGLSNEFGTEPLLIGAASVALAGREIACGGQHALTFGGSKSIIILLGAPALSDPVELDLAPLSELTVSLYLHERRFLDVRDESGLPPTPEGLRQRRELTLRAKCEHSPVMASINALQTFREDMQQSIHGRRCRCLHDPLDSDHDLWALPRRLGGSGLCGEHYVVLRARGRSAAGEQARFLSGDNLRKRCRATADSAGNGVLVQRGLKFWT